MAGGGGVLFRPSKGLWAEERLAVASRDSRPWTWGSHTCPVDPLVPIKGAQGLQRGAFSIFRFWKVLSQEGQMSDELLDTAGASETQRLRVSSLPGTQPVPEAEGLSREVRLLAPPVPAHETTGQAPSEALPPPLFPCFYFLERPRNLG